MQGKALLLLWLDKEASYLTIYVSIELSFYFYSCDEYRWLLSHTGQHEQARQLVELELGIEVVLLLLSFEQVAKKLVELPLELAEVEKQHRLRVEPPEQVALPGTDGTRRIG